MNFTCIYSTLILHLLGILFLPVSIYKGIYYAFILHSGINENYSLNVFQMSMSNVHRHQKLTTDFSQNFKIDYSSCDYYNSVKKKLEFPHFPWA